jgi:hypothetical protein
MTRLDRARAQADLDESFYETKGTAMNAERYSEISWFETIEAQAHKDPMWVGTWQQPAPKREPANLAARVARFLGLRP